MKTIILSLLIILTTCAQINGQYAKSTTNNPTTKALKELKNDPDLSTGNIGFYAINLNTGKIIAQLNPNLCLKPASTMKIITSATAIETLGANYRFTTTIQYDGYIDTASKTLIGNIYIKGGGDPSLGSKYFYTTNNKQFLSEWTTAIKNLKIKKIKGQIIADATAYSWDMIPPTWSWEDIGNYFGAGACGLSVFDNFYTLYFNTSSKINGKTSITKIEPEIPKLKIQNNVKAAKIYSDKSYIFGIPYTYQRTIKGKLPLNKKDYKVKGAMPDPALFVAIELNKALQNEGFEITKQPTTIRILNDEKYQSSKRKQIYTTKSPKLSEIIYKLNMNSINLFAEHLLIQTGIKKGNVNDTKSATNIVESFWAYKGMDTKGLSINDGSGLSYYNAVSPKQLVYILKYMNKKSANYEPFYHSLPIAGQSGTLKRICKGTIAQGKIHAKSGSIRKVRCYAGYATTKSGNEIAFAMMLNGFNCSDKKAKQKLEKLMISIVSINN